MCDELQSSYPLLADDFLLIYPVAATRTTNRFFSCHMRLNASAHDKHIRLIRAIALSSVCEGQQSMQRFYVPAPRNEYKCCNENFLPLLTLSAVLLKFIHPTAGFCQHNEKRWYTHVLKNDIYPVKLNKPSNAVCQCLQVAFMQGKLTDKRCRLVGTHNSTS